MMVATLGLICSLLSHHAQGIYAKAEALYFKGDFEFSLVFFHRGAAIRPENADFRLGIQKAREAIDNAIGSEFRTLCIIPQSKIPRS